MVLNDGEIQPQAGPSGGRQRQLPDLPQIALPPTQPMEEEAPPPSPLPHQAAQLPPPPQMPPAAQQRAAVVRIAAAAQNQGRRPHNRSGRRGRSYHRPYDYSKLVGLLYDMAYQGGGRGREGKEYNGRQGEQGEPRNEGYGGQ
ncbi:uncharacterized protein [Prorops nasuta]|uniref:uncharacterized protein n=1 Tax=Prorops nasuta TaxID=863751 RepID=UPI0034CF367F